MVLFKDGVIYMPGEDNPRQTYDEIRTNIYDNELPIIKVIGFKSVDLSNPDIVRVSDRHSSILESMIELSSTFNDLILMPYKDEKANTYSFPGNIVNIEETCGPVTAANAQFRCSGKSMKALNKQLYLYHALERIGMRLITVEGTKFITMEKSVELISNICSGMEGFAANSYFPLNNEFSIIDYVRILPPVDKNYRYHLVNGMTDDALNILWSRKRGR